MEFTLENGIMEVREDAQSWIITSKTAIVEGCEDETLAKGDIIRINGDVERNGEIIMNVA